jgi:hypothetical protein
MGKWFNRLLDRFSGFLGARKGLLPLIGIVLILVNFILQFYPQAGWWASSNLLLHLGIVLALFGVMLAWLY